ncbi:hypothetical protein D3C86_1780810 [compost metagenome]
MNDQGRLEFTHGLDKGLIRQSHPTETPQIRILLAAFYRRAESAHGSNQMPPFAEVATDMSTKEASCSGDKDTLDHG